jgi:hypothetical protein
MRRMVKPPRTLAIIMESRWRGNSSWEIRVCELVGIVENVVVVVVNTDTILVVAVVLATTWEELIEVLVTTMTDVVASNARKVIVCDAWVGIEELISVPKLPPPPPTSLGPTDMRQRRNSISPGGDILESRRHISSRAYVFPWAS